MIQLKQGNPALAIGSYANAVNNNANVYSFLRTYKNSKVLVVVNLSNEIQNAFFDQDYSKAVSIYGNAKFEKKNLQLAPYQISIFVTK
jgi:glycosidase